MIKFIRSIKSFIIKAIAFVKRDFFVDISYRFAFMLDLIGILASILIFYFVAKLIGKGSNLYLQDYGVEYFPFVLIGIAIKDYLTTALDGYSRRLRLEQMMGTLEVIFATSNKVSIIIISMGLWGIIRTSIIVLIYFLISIFFFGVELTNMNFMATSIILILTVISFSSIGIISSSFIMIFKKGDPISFAMGAIFIFLGGAYFPITILPKGLQVLSHLLPITYTLRALRHALFQGYSIKILAPDIIVLLIFSLILLPLSIFVFKYAVRKAKEDGSLIHY